MDTIAEEQRLTPTEGRIVWEMRKLERANPERAWWSTREIADAIGKNSPNTHAHLHKLRFKDIVEAKMVHIPGFGARQVRFYLDKDGRRWRLIPSKKVEQPQQLEETLTDFVMETIMEVVKDETQQALDRIHNRLKRLVE